MGSRAGAGEGAPWGSPVLRGSEKMKSPSGRPQMKPDTKISVVLMTLTVAFLGLAGLFWLNPGERPGGQEAEKKGEPSERLGMFTSTATVRQSVSELKATGGDLSGLDCYACHDRFGEEIKLERNEQGEILLAKEHDGLVFARMNCSACHKEDSVKLEFDDDFNVIVPEAHEGPAIQHGPSGRNNDCFICHMRDNLPSLKTPAGKELAPEESTELCASCHGPKYKEWEAGVHGRSNGHWDEEFGEKGRKDCTACHDPHAPMFPEMKPAPPPATVRENARVDIPSNGEN